MEKTPYKALINKCIEITEQRNEQYKDTRITAHKSLSVILNEMIKTNNNLHPLKEDVTPHMVALFMVATKIFRSIANPDLEDSYIDMINYAAIAKECHSNE